MLLHENVSAQENMRSALLCTPKHAGTMCTILYVSLTSEAAQLCRAGQMHLLGLSQLSSMAVSFPGCMLEPLTCW